MSKTPSQPLNTAADPYNDILHWHYCSWRKKPYGMTWAWSSGWVVQCLPVSVSTNQVGIEPKTLWVFHMQHAGILIKPNFFFASEPAKMFWQNLIMGTLTAGTCPYYSWLHINLVYDRQKHERTKTRTKCNCEKGKLAEVTKTDWELKKGLFPF